MIRRFAAAFVFLSFTSSVSAESLKTIFNPFTRAPDYITQVDSGTLPSGSTQYIQNRNSLQAGATAYPDFIYVGTSVSAPSISDTGLTSGNCVQASAGGLLTTVGSACGSGGGGGASTLQTTQSGVQITSPTTSLNFLGPPFSLISIGGTTTQISLNSSSVTLQGPNVIYLTSTLQSGATFYVSSGTVQGQLLVNSGNSSNAPAVFQSSPAFSLANGITLNNTYGPTNTKNKIIFASNGIGKWEIGNDRLADGSTNFFIFDGTGGGTRLVIDNNGYVGINTLAPVAGIDATDKVTNLPGAFRSTPTGGNSNTVKLDNLVGGTNYKSQIVFASQGMDKWTIGNDRLAVGTTDFFIFDTEGGTRLIINSSGFVGLGTVSPSSLLHLSSGTLTLDGNAGGIVDKAPNGAAVTYNINAGSMTGAGLTNCGDATHAVSWNSTTGLFGCQSVTGSGGGGASSLGVSTGSAGGYNTTSSSPTIDLNFNGAAFTSDLKGGATSFIGLLSSSVTLQGPIVSSVATTAAILNQQTLQNGATAYPAFAYFGSSATSYGGVAIQNSVNANSLVISTNLVTGTNLVTVSSTPAVNNSDYLFTAASSSGTLMIGIQQNGHVVSSGTVPTLGSCGTGPTISANSTDFAGSIIAGTGSPSLCSITFASAFANVPVCVIADNSTTVTADVSAVSTTGMSVSLSAGVSNINIYFICIGAKG